MTTTKAADLTQDAKKRDALAAILFAGGVGALGGGVMGIAGNLGRPQVKIPDLPNASRWRAPLSASLPPRPQTATNRLVDDEAEVDPLTSGRQSMDSTAMAKLSAEQSMLRQLADYVPKPVVDSLPNITGAHGSMGYWTIPSMLVAGVGTGAATNHLVGQAFKTNNEAARTEELEKAQNAYRRAMIAQYRAAMAPQKTASADVPATVSELGGVLDRMYDVFEKLAEVDTPPAASAPAPKPAEDPAKYSRMLGLAGQKPGWTAGIPFGGGDSALESAVDPAIGTYLAAALGVGGLTGYGAYHWTKSQSPWRQLPRALEQRSKNLKMDGLPTVEIEN